jgi:tubulin--tyrosine ligase
MLPNGFELFGADLSVSHIPESDAPKFQVSLLEINAEPAIELTGARLNWVLVDLFKGIAHTCTKSFFADSTKEPESQGEKQWLRKCLDVEVRGYK